MGPFRISVLGGLVLAVSACASSSATKTPAQAPTNESSVTTTTSAPATPPPQQDTSVAMLTSAKPQTSAVTHEAAPRWTDEQIVAAIAAAQGTENELRTVRDKSKSARVDRLASQILMDQRELTSGQASLSRRIPAQQSEMSTRAADARRALSDAIDAGATPGYDHRFIEAQITYCRAMLQLLDNDMIPSARGQELKSYLQNLRSKMGTRLLQAQEIEEQIK